MHEEKFYVLFIIYTFFASLALFGAVYVTGVLFEDYYYY